jgi:hypothetical protein
MNYGDVLSHGVGRIKLRNGGYMEGNYVYGKMVSGRGAIFDNGRLEEAVC